MEQSAIDAQSAVAAPPAEPLTPCISQPPDDPAASSVSPRERLISYWCGATKDLLSDAPASAATENGLTELLAALLREDSAALDRLPTFSRQHTPGPRRAAKRVPAGDEGLDTRQQETLQDLLNAADVFLLQGESGTGKSRVVREAIRQIVHADERVLVVAPLPHTIDHLLLALHTRTDVLALRCIHQQSDSRAQPAELAATSGVEQAKRLLDEIRHRFTINEPRWQKAASDTDRDLARFGQLRSLAVQARELLDRRAALETQRQQISVEVQSEADQSASAVDAGWLKDIHDEGQRHRTALRDLEDRRNSGEANLQAKQQELDKWLSHTSSQQHLVALRQQRRWLSMAWWRAVFQGRVEERLKEFECRTAEATQAVQIAQEHLADIEKQRDLERQRHESAIEQIVRSETANRLEELNRRLAAATRELDLCRDQWQQIRAELSAGDKLAYAPDVDQLDNFRKVLEAERRQATDCLEMARSRLRILNTSDSALGPTLLQCANLVGANFAALSREPFSGPGQYAMPFDWVIAEDADLLGETQLLALARFGRRLVMVGRPPFPTGVEPTESQLSPFPPSSAKEPAAPFHRIWRALHCNPRRLPFRWFEDTNSLTLQRVPLTTELRQRLEREPLTDLPEVELHILNSPNAEPVLAEVVFPTRNFRIADAKKYLYQQLDELALRPEADALRWRRGNQGLELELHADSAHSAADIVVQLEPGVQEVVRPTLASSQRNGREPVQWATTRLIFDCNQGWDESRAERWLDERTGLRDWRRTATLDTVWRSHWKIASLWAEMWSLPSVRPQPPATASTTTMQAEPSPAEQLRLEFVAAPPVESKPRTLAARTGQRPAAPSAAELSEIDLSDSRQRQRLPLELQMKLPLRGVVNLVEAQKLIQSLERIDVGRLAGGVAVLSWQAPQVQLLEFLWSSKAAGKSRVIFTTAEQFRGREAGAVLVSLYRSTATAPASYASQADEWRTLLTSARTQLILFGDVATLQRHAKGTAAQWERGVIQHLLAFFSGKRPVQSFSDGREGGLRAGVLS